MKYIIYFLLFLSHPVMAQRYLPEDVTSAVEFQIHNFGLEVNGTFKGLNGVIQFNPANLSASSFIVSVDVITVNTDNSTRDKHLRGNDYFDAARFAKIIMKSERIGKSLTPGYYVFFGKLNIKGVEKDISFPFTTITEPNGMRFSGIFKIKRRDFGVGGRSTLSNELTVKLNVFAKKE